jgi:hypothetical protein
VTTAQIAREALTGIVTLAAAVAVLRQRRKPSATAA